MNRTPFCLPLLTDTKGETIFNTVRDYLAEKDIPIQNIIACATDDTPPWLGVTEVFLLFKNKLLLRCSQFIV